MLNGDLKSLLPLWKNLARNHRYSSFVSSRDLSCFEERATNEGLPFLTIALPELGKALDTFHATNTWNACPSFASDEYGDPYFLGAAIKLAKKGNSVAVDCVRQLSYIFYKLEVPHEEAQIEEFTAKFIKNDAIIPDTDLSCSTEWGSSGSFTRTGRPRPPCNTARLVSEMAGLIARILCNTDPLDIRPCHGSGATACHTPNHEKWSKLRYYPKLDAVYDYSTYFFFNSTHLVDELEVLDRAVECEPRARVCFVPKDSRGPRVISCEPAELMFIQQGLMRKLYRTLETNYLTRGQINFIDQSVNQELARTGSISNRYATLDLSDASDLVSLDLVRRVFPSNWVECLEACRSEETALPNGQVVKLNKFAPMGSSCCFPVEALVFWACAQATIRLLFGVKTAAVYVYGDDIICDTKFSQGIMVGLEAIGLKINRSKSYVEGPFRESCGGDYHNGYDVTPIRVRKVLSKVGTGLDTCADLANSFIAKFGYESSHSIIRTIEEEVGFVFPRTPLELPLTLRCPTDAAVNDVLFVKRYNKDLQRIEHRVLKSSANVLQRRPPDWWELLRKELSRERTEVKYPYEHRFSVIDAKQDPGSYVDVHSTRKKWAWCWLG